jgi:hypothetical protein
VARHVLPRKAPVERVVSATIGGQRRTMRVSDLPLGDEGVAGYAVDIEQMEELTRQFRRFREAQRADARHAVGGHRAVRRAPQSGLCQPAVPAHLWHSAGLGGRRRPSTACSTGCAMAALPEVRDFPEWRASAGLVPGARAARGAWHLSDGTHLRVVAQPMPDGGLLLIFEDRTEQLQLSATRDTLLRTRTATFDNLFEALAVFGPDSRVQLWNRRFATDWALDELPRHPSARRSPAHPLARLRARRKWGRSGR